MSLAWLFLCSGHRAGYFAYAPLTLTAAFHCPGTVLFTLQMGHSKVW